MTQALLMVLVMVLALVLSYPYLCRQFKVIRWRRAWALDKHLAAFQQLFAGVDGFNLSRNARSAGDAFEYTYGEIDFISFIALLSLTKPDHTTVFYDLGSGIGKAVIACAMVFPVKKSCGIELFTTIHTAAVNQLALLRQLPAYVQAAEAIYFINDSFLHADFKDATLIFINATAFIGETWTHLNQRLATLHPGITVITTSKQLSSNKFTVIHTTRVQMSWGIVQAYIHQ